MSITISEKAAEQIEKIRNSQGAKPETPLRVSVVSGGCSGLTYDLSFGDPAEMKDENDKEFEYNGIKLIVDMKSFLYLAGTRLDYSDGLEGKGFHFENPNASRTCSCGESFSL